jgi:hypothetical protein
MGVELVERKPGTEYNGPEWRNRQDAIREIQDGLDGWKDKMASTAWKEKCQCDIVRDCAGANTYRAFAKVGKPSHIFRTWAWTLLHSQRLKPIRNERDFDRLHAKLVEELRTCWQCVAEKAISYGPATKFLNLLILHACQCDAALTNRKQLIDYVHVPLDEYVLRAIRQPMCLEPTFPQSLKTSLMGRAHPSMGSITDYSEYRFVQAWIRKLAEEAGASAIILNYLAWELPHGEMRDPGGSGTK